MTGLNTLNLALSSDCVPAQSGSRVSDVLEDEPANQAVCGFPLTTQESAAGSLSIKKMSYFLPFVDTHPPLRTRLSRSGGVLHDGPHLHAFRGRRPLVPECSLHVAMRAQNVSSMVSILRGFAVAPT
jgi:hypothetical protein